MTANARAAEARRLGRFMVEEAGRQREQAKEQLARARQQQIENDKQIARLLSVRVSEHQVPLS